MVLIGAQKRLRLLGGLRPQVLGGVACQLPQGDSPEPQLLQKRLPALLLSPEGQGGRLLLLHASVQRLQISGSDRSDLALLYVVELLQFSPERLQKCQIIPKLCHCSVILPHQEHPGRDLPGVCHIGAGGHLLAQLLQFLVGGTGADLL